MPCAECQSILCANLNRAVGPARDHPDCELRGISLNADERNIVKKHLVPATGLWVLNLVQQGNRHVAAASEPDGETERVVAIKRTDVSEAHFCFAIERDAAANLTRAECRITFHSVAMLIAARYIGEAPIKLVVCRKPIARRGRSFA